MEVFGQKNWPQVAVLSSFMSWVDSNGQLESQLETFQAIKWCSKPWLDSAAIQKFNLFWLACKCLLIPSILQNNKCFPGAAIKPLNGVSLATQPVEPD